MPLPTVSTIIPAYNAANFVREAVESALAQTGVDNEVIVVDDGSTDETPAILRSFGGRIVVLTKQNAGQAAARNSGARIAQGEYLAFLDADDLWLPNKLHDQLTRTAPYVISHTDSTLFGETLTSEVRRSTFTSMKQGSVVADLISGNFMTCSSVVVCKNVFWNHGGFDESDSIIEDWDLWLKICATTQLGYLPEPVVRYRVHNASATFEARKNLVRYSSVLNRAIASNAELLLNSPGLRNRAFADMYRVLAHYAQEGRDYAFATQCALRSLRHEPLSTAAWKQMVKGSLGVLGMRR